MICVDRDFHVKQVKVKVKVKFLGCESLFVCGYGTFGCYLPRKRLIELIIKSLNMHTPPLTSPASPPRTPPGTLRARPEDAAASGAKTEGEDRGNVSQASTPLNAFMRNLLSQAASQLITQANQGGRGDSVVPTMDVNVEHDNAVVHARPLREVARNDTQAPSRWDANEVGRSVVNQNTEGQQAPVARNAASQSPVVPQRDPTESSEREDDPVNIIAVPRGASGEAANVLTSSRWEAQQSPVARDAFSQPLVAPQRDPTESSEREDDPVNITAVPSRGDGDEEGTELGRLDNIGGDATVHRNAVRRLVHNCVESITNMIRNLTPN
ncbi:MAG: hypothetical protein ACJAUP_000309 [Cellvibrionaceae bacterium]